MFNYPPGTISENGQLYVVRGSHKIPFFQTKEIYLLNPQGSVREAELGQYQRDYALNSAPCDIWKSLFEHIHPVVKAHVRFSSDKDITVTYYSGFGQPAVDSVKNSIAQTNEEYAQERERIAKAVQGSEEKKKRDAEERAANFRKAQEESDNIKL